MKVMTKALLCLSLGGTLSIAAPKPLLNPFADTMNTSPSTRTGGSLPSQGTSQTATTTTMDQTTAPLQDSYSSVTSLPTSAGNAEPQAEVLTETSTTRIVVKGQGVAPSFTQSPAQAFALAKRAALVDAYRLLAEKIQGVKVEGQDLIKNMMVKRSQVRTEVTAMISEATIIETEFKDGLCEIEVELIVTGSRWHGTLSHAFAE